MQTEKYHDLEINYSRAKASGRFYATVETRDNRFVHASADTKEEVLEKIKQKLKGVH